jgi:hypothetical protein
MSLRMVSNSVVRRPASRGRPAVLELFARLLSPANPTRSRLRAAQSSLDAAMRFSLSLQPSPPHADDDAG